MKSLEIWSEIKDEATTFKKNDEDASVFLDAFIEPFETLGSMQKPLRWRLRIV